MGKQSAVGNEASSVEDWRRRRRESATGGARAAARVNVALLCQFQVSRGEE